MNRGIQILVGVLFLLLMTFSMSISQSQFKMKLEFTGTSYSDSLWLGMSPYNTRCIDYGIEIPLEWREQSGPPIPPFVNLYARFMDMPGCSTPAGLKPYDYRLYPTSAHVDTFKIRVEGEDIANGLLISWPPFPCAMYGGSWVLRKIGPITMPIDMCSYSSYFDYNLDNASSLNYAVIRTYNPPPPPTFTPSVNSLNFGYVAVGGSAAQVLGVSNLGGSSLSINGSTSPTGYSVTPPSPGSYPIVIPISGSNNFSITFAPTSVGAFNGNIVFTHNASGGTTNIAVTGNAYDPDVITPLLLTSSWNLVSVPRVQSDYDADAVFPGKNGDMYAYNTSTGGYDGVVTLTNGAGYWVNYSSATTIAIDGGAPVSPGATAEQPGWVLVGSREIPVDVSSLVLDNGAVINGNAYRYNPASLTYESTPMIEPGEGVWINVSAACTITIP